ncbi:TetR/AcrR family transcriptional regulator [Streptosporangium subroseum]|uniref:TetR/AcrR family transcriptional regulator n=1 Tax=Streptosporangium subroseum TaxID=106412 RepID=UPI00341AFE0C
MSPESQVPARRPGRPAKRHLIVDAAKRVFLRHGYVDTSIEMIAAEAGVSKQTIYNHFEGKEQLFAAVVQAVQQGVIAASGAAFAGEFESTGDVDRDLRAVFRLIVRLNLSGDVAAFRRLVFIEQMRHPELMEKWTQARPAFELSLRQEVEQQVRLGVLDVDNLDLAVHQLIMLVFNEVISQSRYGLRELPDEEITMIIDDGVTMWLRCYRAR